MLINEWELITASAMHDDLPVHIVEFPGYEVVKKVVLKRHSMIDRLTMIVMHSVDSFFGWLVIVRIDLLHLEWLTRIESELRLAISPPSSQEIVLEK